MSNMDKIVAEMPKVGNPIPDTYRGVETYLGGLYVGRRRGIEAQCQLLAKEGYRKVPSGGEIEAKLLSMPEEVGVGNELCRWLLEGE